MSDTDLCFATLTETSDRIRKRELSPVELLRAQLERIDARNPTLHAYLNVLADSALRTAGYHSAPADRETVAITFLLAAVELLTPELSQAGRARLFLRDE